MTKGETSKWLKVMRILWMSDTNEKDKWQITK